MSPLPIINRLKTATFFIFILSLAASVGCAKEKKKAADKRPPKPSVFDKLSSTPSVEFELKTDWDSLYFYKDDEKYQVAEITFKGESDSLIKEKIKVAARGKTRKAYCDTPPIRLKFPKPFLKASNLAKYKTLKLVTPCKDSTAFIDLLKKEMLCYQMYQVLTDKSFRIQPAKISLSATGAVSGSTKKDAFLIENEKEMAKRLKGKLLDKNTDKIKTIDIEAYNLLTLFQYMIGNTDWNLTRRHNIKLVQLSADSAPIPIPYDFDYSGLVNADYARPHPNLPIKNIRERLFQWRGKNPQALNNTIDVFIQNKNTLFELVENCNLKNAESKSELLKFVASFFEIIESGNAIAQLTET